MATNPNHVIASSITHVSREIYSGAYECVSSHMTTVKTLDSNACKYSTQFISTCVALVCPGWLYVGFLLAIEVSICAKNISMYAFQFALLALSNLHKLPKK